jgi:hypothetical protein
MNHTEQRISDLFGPGVLPAVRMVEPEIHEGFLLDILLAAVPAMKLGDDIPAFLKRQAE